MILGHTHSHRCVCVLFGLGDDTDTAYELSRKEGRVGSPEKPLSDLGQVSYRAYWTWVLLGILREFHGEDISIMDLTRMTSITPDDIVHTLQYHGLVKLRDDDDDHGHRDADVDSFCGRYVNTQYVLCTDPRLIEATYQKYNKKEGPVVDPTKLHWAPLPVPVKKDEFSIRSKLLAQVGGSGAGGGGGAAGGAGEAV